MSVKSSACEDLYSQFSLVGEISALEKVVYHNGNDVGKPVQTTRTTLRENSALDCSNISTVRGNINYSLKIFLQAYMNLNYLGVYVLSFFA